MTLSVNEAKFTNLWGRNCATIQTVFSLKFAFGPKKLPGLLRNGAPGIFVISILCHDEHIK